jgi:hypothetical protein
MMSRRPRKASDACFASIQESRHWQEGVGGLVRLEPVFGTLDIYRLYLPPDRRAGGVGLDILTRHAIMFLVGLRFRHLKSSMPQCLERVRRSEVGSMNGYGVEKDQETGVPTPIKATLTATVREIEAGERPI